MITGTTLWQVKSLFMSLVFNSISNHFPNTEQLQSMYHFTIYVYILERALGPLLAPPEGLRAPEQPGVNPGDRPQESGGDSKEI